MNDRSERRQEALKEIVKRYRELHDQVEVARAIINKENHSRRLYSKAEISKLQAALPAYQSYLNDLAQAHGDIKNGMRTDLELPRAQLAFEPLAAYIDQPRAAFYVRW